MSGGAARHYRKESNDSNDEEHDRDIARLERQETDQSKESAQSATGLSQDFQFMFTESTDAIPTVGIPIDSNLAKSIGVVAVVNRNVVHKKQKKVEPYALQRTFYAYPKNADEEIIRKIRDRIEEELADFRLQNYTVEIYKFGLPFEVEKVGYTGKPKMLKADTKKRKAREDTDEEGGDGGDDGESGDDGDGGEDGDGDDEYRPSSSRTRAASRAASRVASRTDSRAESSVIVIDEGEARVLRTQTKKTRK
jgi:hypothetical protein